MGELEHKFDVKIKMTEDKQKLPAEIKEELKASGMMDGKRQTKTKRS